MSSAASRPQQTANQMTSHMISQTAASQTAVNPSATGLSATGPSASEPPNGQTGSSSNGNLSSGNLSSGNASSSSSSKPASKQLRKPPSRPQLMGPPARPKPPTPAPAPVAVKAPEPEVPAEPQPLGPIPVPSERMQYRAIGLLKGKYVASEEQFNRGDIVLTDGTPIDAVLLGRVTSLIKKHVDLETEHLWVVYPRTLYKDEKEPALHMQIVGVWEPETLNARKEDEEGEKPPILSSADAEEKHCDRFSIRGEIAKYSEDDQEIVVNIVQKSKSETAKPKRPFKLLISGTLTGRTTGYFWDFEVKREGTQLVLISAKSIAVVPPKKKSKDEKKRGGNNRRPSAGKPRSAPVPKPKPKAKSTAPAADEKSAEKSAGKEVAAASTAENAPKEQPVTAQPAETVETVAAEATAAETVAAETVAVEEVPTEAAIADVPPAE